MPPNVESDFHPTSFLEQINIAICNDVGQFAFDCEILFEVVYPLLVIASFCACRDCLKLTTNSALSFCCRDQAQNT